MNIPQTANQKQSIIDSLLSIPGMLRASDLELSQKHSLQRRAPSA